MAVWAVAAPTATAQLAPPASGGAPRLDALLQRLAESRRALLIAAHPDDEDTGLLTVLAQGRGVSVAYLSLSRGDGGQNLIGPELGTSLGLLRTHELLAARALDGASQFFTRAYDFGYTRDLDETVGAWTPDSILKDAVRVVRRARPHVMVTVFSGTTRDGHGQHQMAGVIARRAFAVAGDATAFPELEHEEGFAPWRPLKLYQSARFNRGAATLTLPEGALDPRTGRTYYQIAMASRSQHRSQDFGVLQRLGATESRVTLIESRAGDTAETDLFAGIPRDGSWVAALADSLRAALVPARLGELVAPLARAVARAERDASVSAEARTLLGEALAVAAEVVVDARAGAERMVAGDSATFEADVYHPGAGTVAVERIAVVVAAGAWRDTVPLEVAERPEARLATGRVAVVVPRDAAATQPYFLERPLIGGLYDWSAVEPGTRGLPMAPPPFAAEFRLRVAGASVVLRREVTVRLEEQALGEVRRPVRVVPRLDVKIDPDTLVWPVPGVDTQVVTVTVRHQGAGPVAGSVHLVADGWPTPPARSFQLTRADESRALRFTVRRPPGVTRGDVTLRAEVVTIAGDRFDRGGVEIAYPHIRPVVRLDPAEARVRVAPIALPAVRRVGYVRGASDRVPEALARVGLPLELLEATTLLDGDLSRFDAIVIGSRAYETDSALPRANDRLLAYARAGGRVVVQYQQYAYLSGGFAPHPLTINRPHDRVTDETSPVTILRRDHPVFRAPNAIEPSDWDGWPQERGLYFAGTWDAAWTPLLELRDPERDPVRGGLLVARVGRGTYAYTGLSFFRALPAGVPGAFRIFLNLLDWDGDGE